MGLTCPIWTPRCCLHCEPVAKEDKQGTSQVLGEEDGTQGVCLRGQRGRRRGWRWCPQYSALESSAFLAGVTPLPQWAPTNHCRSSCQTLRSFLPGEKPPFLSNIVRYTPSSLCTANSEAHDSHGPGRCFLVPGPGPF